MKSNFKKVVSGILLVTMIGLNLNNSVNVAKATDTSSVTSNICINEGLNINGFSISEASKGLRTIYSVENEIDGKEVESVGLIYSLGKYATADDMYIGSNSKSVVSYEATENGVLSVRFSDSETETSYARTMKFGVGTAAEFTAIHQVRAYAKLIDGTYVYGEVVQYTIYDVAERMYQKGEINNFDTYNYMYTDILKVVDPDYVERKYDWNNTIVKF